MRLQLCLHLAAAKKGVARADKTKYCQLRAPPPDSHQLRCNTLMPYGDRRQALQQCRAQSTRKGSGSGWSFTQRVSSSTSSKRHLAPVPSSSPHWRTTITVTPQGSRDCNDRSLTVHGTTDQSRDRLSASLHTLAHAAANAPLPSRTPRPAVDGFHHHGQRWSGPGRTAGTHARASRQQTAACTASSPPKPGE